MVIIVDVDFAMRSRGLRGVVYKGSRALFLGATGFGSVNSVIVLRVTRKESGTECKRPADQDGGTKR
jgi:hypothetical protein